ncbi:MAG: hypothetical protein AB7P76_07050 [Candidatus Melainabacteria bacterium]
MENHKKEPLLEKLIAEATKLVAERGHIVPEPDGILTPQGAYAKGMSLAEYIHHLNAPLNTVCNGLGVSHDAFMKLTRQEQLLAFLVYDGTLSHRKAAFVYRDYRLSGSIEQFRKRNTPELYIDTLRTPTSRGSGWATYFLTNRKPELTDTSSEEE